MFKLQTEVILYLIYCLEKENKNNDPQINSIILDLKKLFYNHETNNQRILAHLDKLIAHANGANTFKDRLELLKKRLVITHQATPQEIFLNPLRRQVESLLAINMLINPTTMMMQVVGQISAKIIEILQNYEQLNTQEKKYIQVFLSTLQHLIGDSKYNSVISFGAFPSRPDINKVISVLRSNDAKQLPVIMHIHFKFSLYAFRKLRLKNISDAKFSGEFKKIIERYYASSANYIKLLGENTKEGHVTRCLLADKVICHSPIYTTEPNRGRRQQATVYRFTNTLGLLRDEQHLYETEFPQLPLKWSADAKTLAPDFDSSNVKKALAHEAIYVSGPSGMSALFLHLMENLGRFENIEEKQCYLAAITAYIVGGGFHSMDEVLLPAQYCLKLLPGYNTSVPDGTPKSFKAPPNTAIFYDTLNGIDTDFHQCIAMAWQAFIQFYDKYLSMFNVAESLFIASNNKISARL